MRVLSLVLLALLTISAQSPESVGWRLTPSVKHSDWEYWSASRVRATVHVNDTVPIGSTIAFSATYTQNAEIAEIRELIYRGLDGVGVDLEWKWMLGSEALNDSFRQSVAANSTTPNPRCLAVGAGAMLSEAWRGATSERFRVPRPPTTFRYQPGASVPDLRLTFGEQDSELVAVARPWSP